MLLLNLLAREGIDETAIGDIYHCGSYMESITSYDKVGFKSNVKTIQDSVQRVVHILGVDTFYLTIIFFIKMRLDRYYIIVVIDRQSACP